MQQQLDFLPLQSFMTTNKLFQNIFRLRNPTNKCIISSLNHRTVQFQYFFAQLLNLLSVNIKSWHMRQLQLLTSSHQQYFKPRNRRTAILCQIKGPSSLDDHFSTVVTSRCPRKHYKNSKTGDSKNAVILVWSTLQPPAICDQDFFFYN